MALYHGSNIISNVAIGDSGNNLNTTYTLTVTNASTYVNTNSLTNGYYLGNVFTDTGTYKNGGVVTLNGNAAWNTGSTSKTFNNASVLVLNVGGSQWYCYYINNVYREQQQGIRAFPLTQNTTYRPNGASSCLVEGTLITLANGSKKKVEQLTYDDELLTWDFDNGCQATAHIAQLQRNQRKGHWNKLVLEDGIELYTVYNHSWFNITKNKFTRTVEGTDIGDEIMTINGPKKLVSREELSDGHVWYYNLLTKNNICCYANDILTGNHFCNLYPIVDMKYVKEERELNKYEDFALYCSEETFNAFRIAEYDYSNYDQEAIEAEFRYLSMWQYHVVPHDVDIYEYHNDYRESRGLPRKDFNE